MALQALSFYSYRENVRTAIDKGLNWLDNNSNDSSESYAQVLVAYTSLGDIVSKDKIDNVYNSLMSYAVDGGFCHKKNEGFNQIASEQASYAVVAYERYNQGKTALYNINNKKAVCLK